jgi:hypothetical protein
VKVSNGHLNLINGKRQSHAINMILVDCLDGNLVIGCLDAQSIQEWNVFRLENWNYTFGLIDSLLEDNGCIVFIQGADAKYVGQVRACAKGNFGFELKKNNYCINSIPLHTKTGKMINL